MARIIFLSTLFVFVSFLAKSQDDIVTSTSLHNQGKVNYFTTGNIEAANTVSGDTFVKYVAGKTISFKPGFHLQRGSRALAQLASKLSPIEDTFVRGGSYANSNYGSVSTMEVKKGDDQYHRQVYLRFNLTEYSKYQIKSAKLILHVKSNGSDALNTDYAVHFVSDDGWDENSITWNTKPVVGFKGASVIGNSEVMEWDVLDIIQANGNDYVSFNIQSESIASQSHITFYSKEEADPGKRPQLVIELKSPIDLSEFDQEFSTMRSNYFNWMLGSEEIDYSNPNIDKKYKTFRDYDEDDGKFVGYFEEGIASYKAFFEDPDNPPSTSEFDFSSTNTDGYENAKDIFRKILPQLCMAYHIQGPVDDPNPYYKSDDVLNKIMYVFDYLHYRGWDDSWDNPDRIDRDNTLDNYNITGHAYFNFILLEAKAYSHSVLMMREQLDYADKLYRELKTLDYFTSLFSTKYHDGAFMYNGENADNIRSIYAMRLHYILAQRPTDNTRTSNMSDFIEFMEKALSIAYGWTGTIKPDYTGYHHYGIYSPGYSLDAYHQLAAMNYIINYNNAGAYNVSQGGMDNLVEALLTTRLLANKYNPPFSIAGRFPMNPYHSIVQVIPSLALLSKLNITKKAVAKGAFKRLYDPTYSKVITHVLGKVYAPDFTSTLGSVEIIEDVSSGASSEITPTGSWFKPYGCLSVHRRGEWMVAVKGVNRYVWNFEKGKVEDGNPENLYGWNISSGSIQLNGTLSTNDSGYKLEGWDWKRIPGVTTSNVVNNYTPVNFNLFSKEKFAGGVVQNNNGVFAMQFDEPDPISDVEAKKSVFMFDNFIVVLGSDIQGTGDIETTIAQNALGETPVNTVINGDQQSELESTFQGDGNLVWFTDANDNGYVVPNSQGLQIQRSEQQFMFHTGEGMGSGNFITAWIEHGTNVTNKEYEFYILPSSNVSAIENFASTYSNELNVIRNDKKAHIVEYIPNDQTGIAIFDPSVTITDTKLVSASDQCLVMLDESVTNKLKVAVSNPDFNRDLSEFDFPVHIGDIKYGVMENIGSTPLPTELVFDGFWEIEGAMSGINSITHDFDNDQTRINFDCFDAKTIEVTLRSIQVVSTVDPIADTYVRGGEYANNNYGTVTAMEVKKDESQYKYNRQTYLRFNLTEYDKNSIERAKLILHVKSNGSDALNTNYAVHFVSDDGWGENSISWNTKPDVGFKGQAVVGNSQVVEWDVLDIIQANGNDYVSFNIQAETMASQSHITFYSKEASNVDKRPQLEIKNSTSSTSSSGRMASTVANIQQSDEDVDDNNDAILIYPNPTESFLNIVVNENFGDFNLQLKNNVGVTLINKNYRHDGNRIIDGLDVSSVKSGMYFIEFNISNKLVIKRVVIK